MLKPSEDRCEQNLKKMEIRVKFTGSAEKRVYVDSVLLTRVKQ